MEYFIFSSFYPRWIKFILSSMFHKLRIHSDYRAYSWKWKKKLVVWKQKRCIRIEANVKLTLASPFSTKRMQLDRLFHTVKCNQRAREATLFATDNREWEIDGQLNGIYILFKSEWTGIHQNWYPSMETMHDGRYENVGWCYLSTARQLFK